MEQQPICPKEGVLLRKVGRQYIIVEANERNVNMSDVYSLNPTAALLWRQVEKGDATPETLADYLCETYEVDRVTALHDVEQQVEAWKAYGLVK